MARNPVLHLGALNIKVHPHPTGRYVELFRRVKERRLVGKVRGSEHLMVGWWQGIADVAYGRSELGLEDGIYGEIFKFLDIDPSQPWLNIESAEPMDYNEKNPAPVPAELKPNLRRIPFVFFPCKHRLVFETRSLSPGSAKKAFESIFSKPLVEKEFGPVDVEMETSQEGIEYLLSIYRKTRIEIDLTIPNGDDLDAQDEAVMGRLKRSRVGKEKLVQTSNHPDGIDPDPYTKAMVRLSRSNGKTTVSGFDRTSRRVQASTVDHPLATRSAYDPKEQSLMEAMVQASELMLATILQRPNA